jgi:hypothetical protein
MLKREKPTIFARRFEKNNLKSLIESVINVCEEEKKEKKPLYSSPLKGLAKEKGDKSIFDLTDKEAQSAKDFAFDLPLKAFIAADALHATEFPAWWTASTIPGGNAAKELLKKGISASGKFTTPFLGHQIFNQMMQVGEEDSIPDEITDELQAELDKLEDTYEYDPSTQTFNFKPPAQQQSQQSVAPKPISKKTIKSRIWGMDNKQFLNPLDVRKRQGDPNAFPNSPLIKESIKFPNYMSY